MCSRIPLEMQHYHRCFLYSILFFPKLLLNITFSIFTSIPADRIHDAVHWMLQRYKELHRDDDNMIFTVFPKEKDVQLRIFRGTKRALQGRAFHIRLGDILPLCMLSLQTSLFTQMQQVFQQVRGSANRKPNFTCFGRHCSQLCGRTMVDSERTPHSAFS